MKRDGATRLNSSFQNAKVVCIVWRSQVLYNWLEEFDKQTLVGFFCIRFSSFKSMRQSPRVNV